MRYSKYNRKRLSILNKHYKYYNKLNYQQGGSDDEDTEEVDTDSSSSYEYISTEEEEEKEEIPFSEEDAEIFTKFKSEKKILKD